MLYQLSYSRLVPVATPDARFRMMAPLLWGEQDSNLRSRKTADLQSAPVGRLGISPGPLTEPMKGLEPPTG